MTAHFDCHIILPAGEDLRANAEAMPGVAGLVTKIAIASFESYDL
jgi:hypothetical protein